MRNAAPSSRRFGWFLVLALGLGTASPGRLAAEDFAAAQLKRMKIEPTHESLERFLGLLIQSDEQKSEVRQLIEQLGHADFRKRQSAMTEILQLPVPPIRQLKDAARSPDAEIRARVRRLLLRISRKRFRAKIAAVLNYIDRHAVKGQAELILELLPRLEDRVLVQSAQRALCGTVVPGDADLLRREMAEAPSPRREAAAWALATALGSDALPELLPLLEHSDPAMRLAAGRALADWGDRRCLPVLLDLLEAEDVGPRQQSARILRALTGERFSYSASRDGPSRKAAVSAWRNWYEQNGETAKLRFPLPKRPVEIGRTLVCIWASNAFKEVTDRKQDVFTVPGFKYVWGCHAASDGRRLVVDAVRKTVIEFDGTGQETWKRENLPGRPTGVEGLDNGNVLIACSDSDQVVEIARDGRIVWDFEIEGRPTTAQRLENGNTVINLQNAGRVVEVDQQGNRTTLVEGLDRSHTAQRLDNGNVLVTEMRLNRVDEYDINGDVVWSITNLNNPAQAQRLSNGNTLIGDEKGLHEYDPEKNRVWHLPVTRSRFFRY